VYSVFSKNAGRSQFLYTLGILNSKLMHFFYEHSYNIGMSLTTQVTIEFLSKLPIKVVPDFQSPLAKLVDKVVFLKKRLLEIGEDDTDEKRRIERELSQTDAEIDEMVYKIYGITEAEKKIVEESLE
jgi:hypothetical protein